MPLVEALVPIVDRWSTGKTAGDWLFAAPEGGPMSEGNWKRSVRWTQAIESIGVPSLRVHDLRHYADGRVMRPVVLGRLAANGFAVSLSA